MLWWGCFEIPTPKTLENMQKNVFSVVLIPDWKFLWRYFTRSAQKRKDILRFRNFPEAFTNVWSREICASWKRMLDINKKLSFALKIFTFTIFMIFSRSEDSKHPWWSHFNIGLSWKYSFPENFFFLIVSHFSAHYRRSDWSDLIGLASVSFQTCYGLFPVVPLFTSDEVT